jgi:hypothetical protein
VDIEGVVIPFVIDFNQKRTNLKIFLGKTMSTIQPEIWGIRLKNSRFHPVCTPPSVGQTGTFVYSPDKSHALATVPVTIKTLTNDCGTAKIEALDLMGRHISLKINPEMGLARIAKVGDTYLLPREMKWSVMEGFGEVTASRESYLVKTAGMKLSSQPVKLSPNGHGYYTLRGVNKYAFAADLDPTNLSKSDAMFILGCLGAGTDKIASGLEASHRYGVAEFHGLNFIPTKLEKVSEAIPRLNWLVKAAKETRRNLLKEASFIDNSQSVDALLSLNFVTPANITKFVSKIPHFKASISNLASALIATRLGVKEIPEEAASVAMSKLIEVVDGLERLRASQEVQSQPTT